MWPDAYIIFPWLAINDKEVSPKVTKFCPMLIKPQNCQICLQFAKMEKIGKFGPTGTEYHFADEIQIQRNAFISFLDVI